MTDVNLFQTNDDGNITVENGEVTLTNGAETAVYLSLFGGNVADDGSTGNRQQWWGNADEDDVDTRMTSRTQNLLEGIAATSGNLKRVLDAMRADLAWLGADLTGVSAQLTGVKRVKLAVDALGQRFTFEELWGSADVRRPTDAEIILRRQVAAIARVNDEYEVQQTRTHNLLG